MVCPLDSASIMAIGQVYTCQTKLLIAKPDTNTSWTTQKRKTDELCHVCIKVILCDENQ